MSPTPHDVSRPVLGVAFQEVAERLDGEPAVIPDDAQRTERRIPSHAPGSGNAAVVLRDMDVSDAIARSANRRRGVLLLDVRVEGVEVDAAVGMTNFVDETDGLVERIEVVELETVDDLLGQHNAFA